MVGWLHQDSRGFSECSPAARYRSSFLKKCVRKRSGRLVVPEETTRARFVPCQSLCQQHNRRLSITPPPTWALSVFGRALSTHRCGATRASKLFGLCESAPLWKEPSIRAKYKMFPASLCRGPLWPWFISWCPEAAAGNVPWSLYLCSKHELWSLGQQVRANPSNVCIGGVHS